MAHPSGEEVRRRKMPSVVPIYAMGGAWAVYAVIFPLYRWWHFLAALLVSLAAYGIARHFFPGKVVEVREPAPKPDTGNPDADQILLQGREALEQLRELDAAIADAEISAQIVRMSEIARKIFACVEEDPQKAPQIRRFMNYYLPTTLKLLRAYVRMDAQGVEGENITSTMEGVRGILGAITDAFAKQLDNLMQGVALDISTDIVVLEGMLAQEGLAGDDFDSKQ